MRLKFRHGEARHDRDRNGGRQQQNIRAENLANDSGMAVRIVAMPGNFARGGKTEAIFEHENHPRGKILGINHQTPAGGQQHARQIGNGDHRQNILGELYAVKRQRVLHHRMTQVFLHEFWFILATSRVSLQPNSPGRECILTIESCDSATRVGGFGRTVI